jgi:phospholipase C
VPAFVISPFVQAKTTFSGLLDHTSILKFLGQRFGKDARYSDVVDARPVGSVADLLMGPAFKREIPTIPSLDDYLSKETAPVGFVPGTAPETPMHRAFQSALNAIHDSDGGPSDKFKRLLEAFPKQGIRKS